MFMLVKIFESLVQGSSFQNLLVIYISVIVTVLIAIRSLYYQRYMETLK